MKKGSPCSSNDGGGVSITSPANNGARPTRDGVAVNLNLSGGRVAPGVRRRGVSGVCLRRGEDEEGERILRQRGEAIAAAALFPWRRGNEKYRVRNGLADLFDRRRGGHSAC